jgi:hypothetical protein
MKLYTVDGQNIYCQEIVNGNVVNNLIAVATSIENAIDITSTLRVMDNILNNKNSENGK